MVEATKKAGVIAMMGTQQRAGPHYQKAVELVRSGRLGKVALVTCWNYLTKRTLQWDGIRERIVGDEEATRLLERPRRKGYELPGL
jgi:predicted dehydrogenase